MNTHFDYKCPKCGSTRFTFYEYSLMSYDIDGYTVFLNGRAEDNFTGISECIYEDTEPADVPYHCKDCGEDFNRDDVIPNKEVGTIRPEVLQIIKRSMKEHKEVWEALART